VHEEILSDLKTLLPPDQAHGERLPVARNYQVLYDGDKVDGSQAGVWLQGCNEATHGVSPPPSPSSLSLKKNKNKIQLLLKLKLVSIC
jgi:lysine/ornithine N-monooxygenase